MYLIYIHQYFTTPEKGGGTRSYEFALRLVAKGHSVTVITGNSRLKKDIEAGRRYTRTNIKGIDVIALAVDYSNYMGYGHRIKSYLKYAWLALLVGRHLAKPDLVFATSTPLTVGLPGIILSRLFRVPLVFEVRDLWPEAPIQMGAIRNPLLIWLLRFLESLIYKLSRHIIALSPGMVDGVLSKGVQTEKVSMIPNSSDIDLFSQDTSDSNFMTRWGLYGKFVVAYAGAMGEANALELVIEGAEILQKANDNSILFALAGDGKVKPALEEAIREKGLRNILLMGPLSKHEVVQLYNAASAGLVLFKNLPILQTNSPNKFFDLLAAGLPVVTNMRGWIVDLLEQHRTGITIPPDNPVKLVEALQYLKDNSDLASQMGSNALRLAEKEFNRDCLADRLEVILLEQVKGKK